MTHAEGQPEDDHYHDTPDMGSDGYANVSAGWVLHSLEKVTGTKPQTSGDTDSEHQQGTPADSPDFPRAS